MRKVRVPEVFKLPHKRGMSFDRLPPAFKINHCNKRSIQKRQSVVRKLGGAAKGETSTQNHSSQESSKNMREFETCETEGRDEMELTFGRF